MSIDDLVARGEQLARDAEAEEKRLLEHRRAFLRESDELLKRVRQYMKIVNPSGKPSAQKTAQKAGHKRASPKMLARSARGAIALTQKQHEFTTGDLARWLRAHETSARLAIIELRERGGLRQFPGRGGDRAIYFTVDHLDVLNQIITTSENGNAPTD